MADIPEVSDVDMLAAFGLTPDEPASDPTPDPEPTPPDDNSSEESGEPTTDENNQPDEGGEGGEPTPPAQPQPQVNQKQNQAFARMRTENAAMSNTIRKTAQVLGLNPSLPIDQLAAAIQQRTTEALAKQQNIDPSLLARLDELEARDARYRQLEYENTAKTAFQEIQERFGATPQDLQGFVNDLIRSGYDMSAPGANLVTEFISRNFETILKNKTDAAVRAEQERSAKGSGASNPGKKQGGTKENNETKDVQTMADMEAFLNSL